MRSPAVTCQLWTLEPASPPPELDFISLIIKRKRIVITLQPGCVHKFQAEITVYPRATGLLEHNQQDPV